MPAATVSWMPIAELSRRVGVSPDLLRKWESRYGLFTPARTPGNRRLYSRVDQARGLLMVRHLDRGIPAAQAAGLALAARFKNMDGIPSALIEHAAVTATTTASFEGSNVPMLVADDDRRYTDVNQAACLLLRLRRETVLQMRVDDLTPGGLETQTGALWEAFIRDGTQSGTFELATPDGARLWVDYSAKANVEPGRHLSLLYFPASEQERAHAEDDLAHLTEREREILTMLAMGERGVAIASTLNISTATVDAHIRRCLRKLGAKNRAHAIALGLAHGEIAVQLPS